MVKLKDAAGQTDVYVMAAEWPAAPRNATSPLSGGSALFIAVLVPTICIPITLFVFLSGGHDCADVCTRMPRRHWGSGLAVVHSHASTPGGQLAIARKVTYCEYVWRGAVPTISFTGALFPEYWIFSWSLLIAFAFGWVGYNELHDHVRQQRRRMRPSPLFVDERIMRWTARGSMIALVCTALTSVAEFPEVHNLVAASFYLLSITHTSQYWAHQYVLAVPSTVSWRQAFELLRNAERRHRLKALICCIFGGVTMSGPVVFSLIPLRQLQRFYGPVLEWLLTQLVNTAVILHAYDIAAAGQLLEYAHLEPSSRQHLPGVSDPSRRAQAKWLVIGPCCLLLTVLVWLCVVVPGDVIASWTLPSIVVGDFRKMWAKIGW